VKAALLARAGYDAPRGIFDGPQGLFHSRLGVEDPGPELLSGLGQEYGIASTMMKRRSAGGPNQAPRQGLVELMEENRLTAVDIAEIAAEVSPAGFNTITHVHHPSIEGKDVLALAAVYGGIGFLEAHHEKYFRSTEALAMRERVKILLREDWAGQGRFRAIVTIKTRDGREFRRDSTYRPMTEQDVDVKFLDLVTMRAGEDKARQLASVLKRLDTVGNISDVMTSLELPEARIEEF
jgi:2-methylcitrate dehydratase PrpD